MTGRDGSRGHGSRTPEQTQDDRYIPSPIMHPNDAHEYAKAGTSPDIQPTSDGIVWLIPRLCRAGRHTDRPDISDTQTEWQVHKNVKKSYELINNVFSYLTNFFALCITRHWIHQDTPPNPIRQYLRATFFRADIAGRGWALMRLSSIGKNSR